MLFSGYVERKVTEALWDALETELEDANMLTDGWTIPTIYRKVIEPYNDRIQDLVRVMTQELNQVSL